MPLIGSINSESFPDVLTSEEEKYYLDKWQQKDFSARNTLIEHNLRLVAHIVKKYEHSNVDKDDLIQAGLIGLWRAAYNYDDTKNVKFSTYAVKYILGEIKDELKKINMIKISRKYYRIINELNKTEHLDEDEICNRLGCSKEDIMIASSFINNIVYVNEDEIPDYKEDKIEASDKVKDIVRTMLETKKFTQKEIALRIGKSQSTVSRMIKDIKENEKE